MEHIIHPLHGPPETVAVENGTLDEFARQPVQIALAAGSQIVQHPHPGPPLKMFHQMAADEAGAAGDQDVHCVGVLVDDVGAVAGFAAATIRTIRKASKKILRSAGERE